MATSQVIHATGLGVSYTTYQYLTVLLSVTLLLAVVVLHFVSSKVNFLHHTFRAVEIKRGRLYFLGVNLTVGDRGRQISHALLGVIRMALALGFLHVWQAIIIL
eukprot:Selendium_serpulae@DN5106_c0_g1_i4.p2